MSQQSSAATRCRGYRPRAGAESEPLDAIHGDDETRRGGAAADHPASMAEKLEQILATPHLRADNGYQAVHRDFTAARMAGGFEAVCLSAMEENSLPHAPVPKGL